MQKQWRFGKHPTVGRKQRRSRSLNLFRRVCVCLCADYNRPTRRTITLTPTAPPRAEPWPATRPAPIPPPVYTRRTEVAVIMLCACACVHGHVCVCVCDVRVRLRACVRCVVVDDCCRCRLRAPLLLLFFFSLVSPSADFAYTVVTHAFTTTRFSPATKAAAVMLYYYYYTVRVAYCLCRRPVILNNNNNYNIKTNNNNCVKMCTHIIMCGTRIIRWLRNNIIAYKKISAHELHFLFNNNNALAERGVCLLLLLESPTK